MQAGIHSNIVGYGLNDIPYVKKSWILLNWQIKIIRRPKYGENILIKTWSRGIDRLYAYRDFEIVDENKITIAIATSKWVLADIEKRKIIRIPQEVCDAYTIENINIFNQKDIIHAEESDNYINSMDFVVNRNLIDVNDHLHNIYFMDIANEILPLDVYKNVELNNIFVTYKKEIKLGDTVKAFYNQENDKHIVVIKSYDCSIIHAIIEQYA